MEISSKLMDERMEQEELLKDLGSAVRSLLEQQSSNPQIWGVYSGMAKVLELIELVVKDGSMKMDYRGRPECRSFVLETSGASGVGMFGSCSIVGWAQIHLANQRLSIKLRELYSDKERLKEFYRPGSILMDPVFRQTFLLIIEALEHLDIHRLDSLINDDSHEAEVDEKPTTAELDDDVKLQTKENMNSQLKNKIKKTHRRSVSCPIIQEGEVKSEKKDNGKDIPDCNIECLDQGTKDTLEDLMKSEDSQTQSIKDPSQDGDSEINKDTKVSTLSPSTSTPKTLGPVRARGHRRGASDSGLRFSRSPEPCLRQRSEDINSSQEIKGTWSEVMPAKLGSYQKPKANQSLVSFLSETGLAASHRGKKAQLDRENAHFVLSEAMIGTLEHMTFDSSMRSIDEEEQSDEEIRELKEKLRLKQCSLNKFSTSQRTDDSDAQVKQKPRQKVRRPKRPVERRPKGLLSDGRTDTGTTDQSASTDCNSDEENCLSGEELDRVLDSNDEEFSLFEPGSKDFLADIPLGSAESIALSLLGQIGAGRLPPADQIPWLVTEQEAPQQLLPLPDSLPVDPDEDLKGATELRGNLVWAPPRPQLVLTIQEKPSNRKVSMSMQRWQCTGCALRVEEKYSKSFRFCNYLGKYFCTGCHENQMAIIPARVVQNWDFKKYPVSNFSMEILTSVYTERLFNIMDLNPGMIRKVEKLKSVCKCRHQLIKLNKYIITCKYSQDLITQMEAYVSQDPYLFSIQDLFQTKFHKLGLTLRSIIGEGMRHVQSCQLCQAHGYICEGCHSGDIIFPFQGGIHECKICSSCYHKACFNPDKDSCSKCLRLQERKERSKEITPKDDEI